MEACTRAAIVPKLVFGKQPARSLRTSATFSQSVVTLFGSATGHKGSGGWVKQKCSYLHW